MVSVNNDEHGVVNKREPCYAFCVAKDWTKLYKKYKGLWVALAKDEKTALGSGKTLKEAWEQAQKKGYRDPIMTRMPPNLNAFVGGYEIQVQKVR